MKTKLKLFTSLLLGLGLWLFSSSLIRAEIDGEQLSVDPRSYWYYACAVYAQRVGDASQALADFQQAARYDPKSSAIHDRLAYHYYVEGLDYKSVEELQKSKELQPNNIETRMMLAELYSNQG